MTKKKSFITLLLAFCLIIPAMFMLTACGGAKITEKEWNSALSFEGVDNYSMKMDATTLYERDGAKLHIKDGGQEYYYDRDGTAYKEYYANSDGTWTLDDDAQDDYESWAQRLTLSIYGFNYKDFTYNKKTNSFEAESVTIMGDTATNVAIKFENGLLMKLEFTLEGETQTCVISYNTVSIDLSSLNVRSAE